MRRFLILALAVTGLVAIPAAGASVQSRAITGSPGCEAVNDPALDGWYVLETVGPIQFLGGEVITASAGAAANPLLRADPETQLVANSISRDIGSFPGTVSWTIPADGVYEVMWRVIIPSEDALQPRTPEGQWTVTCTPGPSGHIVVMKAAAANAPAAVFTFDPSWTSDFTLSAGGAADSGELTPGLYSVAEIALPLGWSLRSTVCSDGSTAGAIALSANETVTCTFTNTYQTCFGQAPTIRGTAGPDTLRGTPGPDVIVGLGGNDTINGLGGDDRICGGAGADLLIGGAGDDRLLGGAGNDTLQGLLGRDRLTGGPGTDSANGGRGTDVCNAETVAACE